MLSIAKVKKQFLSTFPAITHYDGTARVQAVFQTINPRFHSLLKHFKRKSRFPIILNTSFNVNNEPIVEKPYDALKTFFWSELDYLFLQNFLISKV